MAETNIESFKNNANVMMDKFLIYLIYSVKVTKDFKQVHFLKQVIHP